MTTGPAPHVLPRPGDFGITPGTGWAMRIIRLGTFSRYGHAAEVVDVRQNFFKSVQIVEAMPTGVRIRWVGEHEFRWSTGGKLNDQLTPYIRARLVARALDQIGRGYDWPSVAAFIPRFFGAKFGYSPDHPDQKLFCSELVVWNRLEENIVMFPGKAPGDISPGMLEDFCPPVFG